MGYVFTYEINWKRNLPANIADNLYPTHFTYNFLNNGDPEGTSKVWEGWDIIKENGCPSVATYGGICVNHDPTYWMTGYEKYHSALLNTIDSCEKISFADDPELGLDLLKELKLKGYWTNARLILQGKKKMPKYAQKAFYSNFAHSERLRELLEWAKTNEQIQKCLKRNAMKKAERLIKQESIERYGIGSNYAVKYAKLVIVRLRKGSEIYTEWGIL